MMPCPRHNVSGKSGMTPHLQEGAGAAETKCSVSCNVHAGLQP